MGLMVYLKLKVLTAFFFLVIPPFFFEWVAAFLLDTGFFLYGEKLPSGGFCKLLLLI